MGNGQGKPVDLSGETNLNHFRLLRVVGRGAFGKVRIVERKDTNLTFALKYIRKDEVVKSESVRNIIRERRMLEHVNHPFICNLRYSFQDIEYMYLVVDLMSGGDLRFHISRKTFTEEAVRFWIAELGCALKYIHGQNIIHRDVKPDNVLLDADGHVHLTDFNVASDIVPGRVMTSKSGTLAYLAPEVYAGKGYDMRADWWSLGVLFYECIYNKRPFDGTNEATLSQQIQFTTARYPVTQPPVSLTCLYAIRSAMDPNPNTRLGCTWESFIHNDFFMALNFDYLEQKRIEPIFVPSSDKTNFDATYDLEELLLEEAPLEARARRQKPRERLKEDATEQEIREDELYRMIDTDFRPFDYTVAAYKKITAAQGLPGDNSSMQTIPGTKAQIPGVDDAAPTIEPLKTFPAPPIQPPSPPIDRPGRTSRPPGYQSQQYVSRPMPASKRVTSSTGGVQVTLDGGGSWSDLARQDATLPRDANTFSDSKSEHSGGVFGFLKNKRGRNNSPKPRERGVLGKEGARVVIS
ncbi:Serine/threonine-protein kinase 32C [Cladobotryum mycophilum]|uniref:Serine/threonine-protein kinase 32C n=1 Tax=Cladobotryum mycophilum TaxID=491253 RepID=A0ABR0SSV4_9HYPO